MFGALSDDQVTALLWQLWHGLPPWLGVLISWLAFRHARAIPKSLEVVERRLDENDRDMVAVRTLIEEDLMDHEQRLLNLEEVITR